MVVVSTDAAASESRLAAAVLPLGCVVPVGGPEGDMATHRDCSVAARPEIRASFDEMRQLADDWDEEGAPRPSDDAIERAHEVLRWLDEDGIQAFDLCVDPDVLGGVGVLIWRDRESRAWVSCDNKGRDTVVCSDADGVRAFPWGDEGRALLSVFLRGEGGP